MNADSLNPADRRRAPWSLAIAALTLAVQNGVVTSFAVLYLPLIDEFGGSRAEVATVQSAVLLLGGFGAPIVGWGFDRLGPRRLLQSGAVLAALGLAAASRAHSLPALVATYGLIAGLGLAALGSHSNMILAALWYPDARGRAIAVADVGTGLGAFLFVPVAQALTTRTAWRVTLLVWAVVLVGVLVPLNAFQRAPRSRRASAVAAAMPSRGGSLRDAARTSAFWWLGAMRFFGACAFPVLNVHMVAYAVGQGIGPAAAATALASVSLVSLGGRLATGWLCDRLGRAETLTITYTSAAIGIGSLAMLTLGGGVGWLAAYVVLYGLAQGSTGIVGSARAADVFAGPGFGAIYGCLALASGPGEALGAWLGGRVFDGTGSYLGAFAFAVIALAAGVASIWRVRSGALVASV
jgi:MFS transporter, OFA family, oxalate/formate antiporter